MTAGLCSPATTFLVHGGAGGIGTFAIQLAKPYGARVLHHRGFRPKSSRCARDLGADIGTQLPRSRTFLDVVSRVTDGRGVDVILDNMGAKYLADNVESLADLRHGWSSSACRAASRAELDIAALLKPRADRDRDFAAGPSRPSRSRRSAPPYVEHVWH
jgi:NADPH:quinone reductase-like Zn-dependent oxidoreductase